MNKRIILAGLAACYCCSSYAQEKATLTFAQYMENVKNGNISYLAEKYNVDIADAGVKAARVFPDPELSVNYGNNQNWSLRMGYAIDASLSYTWETGGKRKARIRLAQSEKEMTAALLEDYFRNLRADASLAWLEALKQQKLYELQKSSYEQMLELARADSVRYLLGDVMEADARQSRLEAAILLNDLYASQGARNDALAQLRLFQGDKQLAPPDSIAGEPTSAKRAFELPALIAAALANRADLQAALKSQEVSLNNLRLSKANRFVDIGLTLGAVYASEVKNEIAPAPAYKGFAAGISIPLKLSNANKAALHAAQSATRQDEVQYAAAEIQITAEVIRAYDKYQIACRQVEQFDAGLLREAEAIFVKRAYSYQRGETGVSELLNARRTCNDIRQTYIEALYNCAAALVEIERAACL
ncbi:MAG: TolC family protein [Tannerellaceae bacterium]|jgi:cobalt-zinc-cadmium efflux system outer membrane protein|nr:TolC family protein [Tannerellaceae bacterium]